MVLSTPSLLIPYPDIGAEIFRIGPFAVRWYALAYVAGLLLGWRYLLYMAKRKDARIAERDADDFLLWATLGVVLGGRLGYVLFYQPLKYAAHPLEIFYVWQGGMSFHGGLLGVITALILFARVRRLALFDLTDLVAQIAPLGLLFGRIANFINGELWGRPSDVPWAMIFPMDELRVPRHPSQLYEAGLEGVILFATLWLIRRYVRASRTPGVISGCFLIGYGTARIIGEVFREPDVFLGYLINGSATMGQILSVPMVAFGIGLIWYARRQARAGG
ncbi:MAG TPA: prolipoprotein diacylglyceryl transferase [Candidatus Cybelea sp.]|nr:prolipoprotein diacylglyceryl transferase [Candidatus Cybelea sp.]